MKRYAKINYNNREMYVLIRDNHEILEIMGDLFSNKEPLIGNPIDIKYDKLEYLIPVNPTKVVGLGWNYKDLVGPSENYDEPIIFLKSPSSVALHNSSISLPKQFTKVWVEVELVIIIGKKTKNLTPDSAEDSIWGYTIGSDITALNINDRDWHLARSKAIDDFAPIGPHILTGIDISNLELKTFINKNLFQNGNTKNLILNPSEIVSLVSKFMTLESGDLIFTGTPSGATSSIVVSGDSVQHSISDIGTLKFVIE